jgi:hypothetical protein
MYYTANDTKVFIGMLSVKEHRNIDIACYISYCFVRSYLVSVTYNMTPYTSVWLFT